ncbi:NAD(P)/FAD-dependent oxidoreductase [Cupriavidus plantarum]|uniref:NAD(P)/FAD-dependent oxidoreductase n=1 Tax=Cupriavidus plantarum TaxID=942865 RepID=UPI001B025372|nr:FAD-dependent oxidoreductase [Cupriavidus plantarum]CAG2137296.1 NADH dehydrogenase-like protein [Cupriavidus plantarum]SMR84893.1 NADH dehydrogenase [Cupriavidus plantarum]
MDGIARIVVVGGGFAGLWSAAAAARTADELRVPVRITLVNRNDQHSIRVRNYEADLAATRVPLHGVLDPIGVSLVVGDVTDIDTARHAVHVGDTVLAYDKLILASGSELARPALPGAEHLFDIDTYAGAMRLQAHFAALAALAALPGPHAPPARPGRWTVVVVGSGATGVELACELPARLRALLGEGEGEGKGEGKGERACRALGIELMPRTSLAAVAADGVTLTNGTVIAAATVVWCAGMRASGLTARVPGDRDTQGRLLVDAYMRVQGVPDVFAAGDVAHASIDGVHPSVMSCQHARPMGRYAGYNAVCSIAGTAMRALDIDWYTNIIDLGPLGAVYAQGWDRVVVDDGMRAKATKQVINRERIYPPRDGDRAAIFAAAAAEVQRPPALKPLGPDAAR